MSKLYTHHYAFPGGWGSSTMPYADLSVEVYYGYADCIRMIKRGGTTHVHYWWFRANGSILYMEEGKHSVEQTPAQARKQAMQLCITILHANEIITDAEAGLALMRLDACEQS